MTREEEVKARLEKATPSPWVATENHVSCPLCDGEGDVDALTLDAVGPWAVTVQVYGIGTDFKNHEAFLHHAPDDIRYLLSRNEELQRRVEKMEGIVQAAKRACRGTWKRAEENFSRVNYKDLEALQDALDAADAEEK